MESESSMADNAVRRVTVVLRSLNRRSLFEALDSVALQTWTDIEVLVVNAVGAGHVQLPAHCGPSVLRCVDRGRPLSRSAAANLGLAQATGRWVCFLDDDDLLEPGHIMALAQRLEQKPAVAAYAGVRCMEQMADGGWREVMRYNQLFDAARLLYENYLPIHAVLFERAAALKTAGFDEALTIFEDWDFWIQLSRLGPFEHVDQISAIYRLSSSGSGLYGNEQLQRDSAQMVFDKWHGRLSKSEWNGAWRLGRQTLRQNAGLESALKSQEQINKSQEQINKSQEQIIQRTQEQLRAAHAEYQQLHLRMQEQLGAAHAEYEQLHRRMDAALRSALAEYGKAVQLLRKEQFTVIRPMGRHIKKALRQIFYRLPDWSQAVIRRILRRLGEVPGALPALGPVRSAEVRSTVDWRTVFDATGKMDLTILVFPVIDWHFRIQRPQHLASELAARGHRVVYLSTTWASGSGGPECRLLGSPAPNVHLVQLALPGAAPNIYKDMLSEAQSMTLIESLQWLRREGQWGPLASLVDLPFWRPVALGLPGNWVVYDCMDYHAGFANNTGHMLGEEQKLLEQCDLLVTSSATLAERMQELALGKPHALIRNGAEVQHFNARPTTLHLSCDERKVVGYFGAIAEWFDIHLVTAVARARPDWRFVLVGATTGCDVAIAKRLPNIEFIGEVAYADLPGWVHGFDVCMIPFILNELTACTNPVKVYEYLSAGKAVVATRLPELELIEDQLYLASGPDEFLARLEQAMVQHDNQELARHRREWAGQNSWQARADQLVSAIQGCAPKVSVIVLCYNNLALTRACIESVQRHSYWPGLELVVVDNASTDGTRDFLVETARKHPGVRLVLNDDNLGFAAGNNAGLDAATGDVLILLNNDTQVSPGWIHGLVRHLQRDPALGMVGPVTNNIGNEARIDVGYSDLADMPAWAARRMAGLIGQRYDCPTLAFFCVALKRQLYKQVGGLDPIYGIGFFEDDDYCNRARAAGWLLTIADDVFVHHQLSASFDQMHSDKRQALFARNKALYENKWGPWIPHRYRDAESESAP